MNSHDTISISEMFSSVQGEGIYAGMFATFIRLQGCSVHCSFCDEKESWSPNRGGKVSLGSILEFIRSKADPLVVITGGEPLEYAGLAHLVSAIRNEVPTALIQLETSGLPVAALENAQGFTSVCISPKILHTPASHKSRDNPYANPTFWQFITQHPLVFLKLVIEDYSELIFMVSAVLPSAVFTAGSTLPLIFVNPVDYGGDEVYPVSADMPAFRKCIDLAHSRELLPPHIRAKLRFGLQLHKIFSME